jgi:DNA-binding XRE family transcriptional regulator
MSNKKLSTIAKNIKLHRKEKGFSQDRLSKMAEVAYNTIVKIESGENPNPTVYTLVRIAKSLNIPIEKLFKE